MIRPRPMWRLPAYLASTQSDAIFRIVPKVFEIICTEEFENNRRRVLLSGTPMQNDLEEFFSMVDFTNPGIKLPPECFLHTAYCVSFQVCNRTIAGRCAGRCQAIQKSLSESHFAWPRARCYRQGPRSTVLACQCLLLCPRGSSVSSR